MICDDNKMDILGWVATTDEGDGNENVMWS